MKRETQEGERKMKINRLINIILLLLDRERICAQELANLFEVSPRTIYRDIDAINLAGIPVRSTPGAGGGFEIMPEYKVDKKVFSAADLSAILIGLSSLSGMIRGDELAAAFAKVKSFIPAEKATDIEVKANQIYIDLHPWIGRRDVQPNLETIKTALQESRLLSFTYTDRYGNRTVRPVEPYQLVLKGNQWYWQGYCRTRNDFRLFKLSRISDLQILEESFAPRTYPKPQLDLSDILPALQTKIELRVHQSILDRVLDFCSDEDVSPDGEEQFIVHFPFIENDFYYNILFSFGDQCECLEPQKVRAEMKRRIRGLAALYEN